MSGPVALITGASRGIGRELLRRFKSEGYRVAACSSSDRIFEAEGEADLTAVCDVSNAEAVRHFVAEAHAKFGRIDVLVNNAGLAGANRLDGTDELWHQVIGVNLHGTYYFTKHVLPHLPSGSGRVINIASVLALKGVPDQTAYCAAKHGVLGFTRALAHEVAPRGITVNAICPGWTRTEMALGRMRELGWSEERLLSEVPTGRWTEPSEVAGLALFLAGAEAGSITGQALTVDGGVLA